MDVGERILSSFFRFIAPPEHGSSRPLSTGVDLSPLIKEVVRIRRASGVDDASIRTQVLNVMARNLDQFGAYTRDRKMQALVRAIDEALAEPTATRPKSSAIMVKVRDRRSVAGIVEAARKEGVTDAALREHLATHLAGMRREMEKWPRAGISTWLVEESLLRPPAGDRRGPGAGTHPFRSKWTKNSDEMRLSIRSGEGKHSQ